MSYITPSFRLAAFNCPYCRAYAQMRWAHLQAFSTMVPIHQSICSHCGEAAFWLAFVEPLGEGRMLIPENTTAPLPYPNMPDVVLYDYEEARLVAGKSPRSSAALLRLAIQKLCIELGEKGRNVNDDIASLVKKGLPVEIQQALDIVRVVGNNAVHPGELSSDDVSEISTGLFELVNQIVEDRISRPKKLQAMFDKLPAGAREAIQKRDGK